MSGNRGGSFGGSKSLRKTPISVREAYNIKIKDVNRQANAGIDKIEDFVNFVSNASPRERVMLRTEKVGIGDAGPNLE
jgi:predicted RNA-binding protein with TRAM domain